MRTSGSFILTQENVSDVFPGTHPGLIISDEFGFIVGEFQYLYPRDIKIYCTRNFYGSATAATLSVNFEDYFYPLDKTVEYLSRRFEVNAKNVLAGQTAEYATIFYSKNTQIFTLDRIMSGYNQLMLCRKMVAKELSVSAARAVRETFRPSYIGVANLQYEDGKQYIYWTAYPHQIISNLDLTAFIAEIPDKFRKG